jgi:ATPase MipZ
MGRSLPARKPIQRNCYKTSAVRAISPPLNLRELLPITRARVKQSAPDHSGPGRNSKDTGFSRCAWSAGRPVYREFFAAGLTVFDPVEGFTGVAESNARLEVQDLIREIGLIEDEAPPEIELEIAGANAEANDVIADKEDLSAETNERAVTLVPGLPIGS